MEIGELSLSTCFGSNFLNFPLGNTYIKRLLFYLQSVGERERRREMEIWFEKGGSGRESASYNTFEKILNVIAGNLAEVYHVPFALFPPWLPPSPSQSISLLSIRHGNYKIFMVCVCVLCSVRGKSWGIQARVLCNVSPTHTHTCMRYNCMCVCVCAYLYKSFAGKQKMKSRIFSRCVSRSSLLFSLLFTRNYCARRPQ